jgi:hypothetical protein
VKNLARRNSLEVGSTQEKKGRGRAGKRKKLRVKVWHGKLTYLGVELRVVVAAVLASAADAVLVGHRLRKPS